MNWINSILLRFVVFALTLVVTLTISLPQRSDFAESRLAVESSDASPPGSTSALSWISYDENNSTENESENSPESEEVNPNPMAEIEAPLPNFRYSGVIGEDCFIVLHDHDPVLPAHLRSEVKPPDFLS